METTRQGEEVTRVAFLERRNRDSGNVEEVRFNVSEFRGKLLMSARVWYRVKPTGPDDDGWRPSKSGFSVREHEIDLVVSGLEKYRAMIAERPGRRTRESRQDQPPTSRAEWKPAPHHRSEVHRSQPIPNRLPARGADFDEFGEDGRDG